MTINLFSTFSRKLLLQNYQSQNFIKKYIQNAPNLSTKILLNNYLKILTEKKFKRPKIHHYKKTKEAILRISIFSSIFNRRLYHLALLARKNGCRLQLLYNHLQGSGIPYNINKNLFDNIIPIGYPFSNMEEINELTLAFGSDLILCHTTQKLSDTIFPFILTSKLPIVVDLYNTSSAIKHQTQNTISKPQQFFIEQIFKYANGYSLPSKNLNPDLQKLQQNDIPLIYIDTIDITPNTENDIILKLEKLYRNSITHALQHYNFIEL